eukprot:Tamp_18206.p1 GENE.Tamp_18206~~Tamp_18206.p1  ORF type:complete len:379 (+),score=46.38 Tamp_18206:86-1222(+)
MRPEDPCGHACSRSPAWRPPARWTLRRLLPPALLALAAAGDAASPPNATRPDLDGLGQPRTRRLAAPRHSPAGSPALGAAAGRGNKAVAARWDERDAPVAIPGSVGRVVVGSVLRFVLATFAYQSCLDLLVASSVGQLLSPGGLLVLPALFVGIRSVWRATLAALRGDAPAPVHGSVPWFDVALAGSERRSAWGWLAWPAAWIPLQALSGPDHLFPINWVLGALSHRQWFARLTKHWPGGAPRGGEQVLVSKILAALRDPSARGNAVLASLLFNVCILSPIVEELFFRGYLIPALVVRGLSGPVAVATSACAFAAVHLSPGEVDHVWFGVMCGVAYASSGTLLAPIAIHMLNNGSIIYAHLRAAMPAPQAVPACPTTS